MNIFVLTKTIGYQSVYNSGLVFTCLEDVLEVLFKRHGEVRIVKITDRRVCIQCQNDGVCYTVYKEILKQKGEN